MGTTQEEEAYTIFSYRLRDATAVMAKVSVALREGESEGSAKSWEVAERAVMEETRVKEAGREEDKEQDCL